MKNRYWFIWLCFFCVLRITPCAQAAIVNWECTLPGGVYTVAVSTITSVSVHEYLSDGALKVTEATINTTGPVVARFYYIEKIKIDTPGASGQMLLDQAQQRVEQVAGLTGNATLLTQTVVKNYPTTTHAKTVEYRLNSVKEVQDLFKSVRLSWINTQNGTFKLP